MIHVLCLIATEDRLWNLKRAFRQLEQCHPGLMCGHLWDARGLAAHPEQMPTVLEEGETCDFALIYFHGGAQVIGEFDVLWHRLRQRMPIYFESALPEEISELLPQSGLDPQSYRAIGQYFHQADASNFQAMLLHIAATYFGKTIPVPPPQPSIDHGFYTLSGILTPEEGKDLRRRALEGNKPVVGLILHQSQIINGNTRHIDAVLAQLEKQDVLTLPLFTRMANDEDERQGIRHAMERYFMWEGKKLPDVILVMSGFSMTHMSWPGDGVQSMGESIFAHWGVLAIQVMATRMSRCDYEEKSQGMDPMSLSTSIFQPELDGQIISVPCATQEITEEDGILRKIFVPIADRVERVCKMAENYAKLRHLPQKEKKIAILFHAMPGNARIGCAEGLDTFESVHQMIRRLQQEGIQTDFDFQDGQDIASRLTRGLTNDLRWVSEESMTELAAAVVPKSIWQHWFASCPQNVQNQLQHAWGTAPGDVMCVDEQLLIPGIRNGNLFIGIQPSRAFGEQAEKCYHNLDATPPYSYIAYYRWLEECFGANALCHIGTHGTVEWLPGKQVGLSSSCYGDLCLGSIPNFYPYHIGVTGEGIQAKRRSFAVILDHMPPPQEEAGVYEDLAVIDEALKEYHQACQMRHAQVGQLARRIFDLAQKAHVCTDLHLTEEDFLANPQNVVEEIHLWISDLKNAMVKEGLHILGQVPQGRHYQNQLRSLVRAKNGHIPSLNSGILQAMGYDSQAVAEHPDADFDGLSGEARYEEAMMRGRQLVAQLDQAGYQVDAIPGLIRPFPGSTGDLETTLRFLCQTVTDKLNRTTDEMDHLIAGLNGCFVPPSLGGNPTRGNVNILPTGRNFYASDPYQIPSRAAWDMGVQLAKQMLNLYQESNQDCPESIAMVVWAGNTLKTCGEDFAECLYLMGVRPVYLGESTRVIGVEPIPLSELGRPRLDVTLRISGLFRDMYPNLIQLMDQAVTMVADLDEPEEENFIKKHIRQDLKHLTDQGIAPNQALDQAYTRIFGCAPGCYGAGVAKVIDSRQWKDARDLAAVYENWSSYAYSSRSHGVASKDAFRRRMASIRVTIKNESTCEFDMMDSDDFYAYHGGLVACVKANSGQAPLAVTGHTDDPDHPVTRSLEKEAVRIVRSRILNPKWLDGLKEHGFQGAQQISAAVDSLFGWDATAEVGQDWMYESVAQRFLFDQQTRQWMEEANRWSVHALSERLLEAQQRGMWNADPATVKQLQAIYMNSEGAIEDMTL